MATPTHDAHWPFGGGEDAKISWRVLGLEREPPLGAHLTTSRRGYTHHGVYVGGRRVVHYSGLSVFWQCGPVEEVGLTGFAKSRPVHIVHHDRTKYPAEEIVRRARSRLGEDDYRLLTNNCEHFCNWCLSGVSRSVQVERRLPSAVRFLAAWLLRRCKRNAGDIRRNHDETSAREVACQAGGNSAAAWHTGGV